MSHSLGCSEITWHKLHLRSDVSLAAIPSPSWWRDLYRLQILFLAYQTHCQLRKAARKHTKSLTGTFFRIKKMDHFV